MNLDQASQILATGESSLEDLARRAGGCRWAQVGLGRRPGLGARDKPCEGGSQDESFATALLSQREPELRCGKRAGSRVAPRGRCGVHKRLGPGWITQPAASPRPPQGQGRPLWTVVHPASPPPLGPEQVSGTPGSPDPAEDHPWKPVCLQCPPLQTSVYTATTPLHEAWDAESVGGRRVPPAPPPAPLPRCAAPSRPAGTKPPREQRRPALRVTIGSRGAQVPPSEGAKQRRRAAPPSPRGHPPSWAAAARARALWVPAVRPPGPRARPARTRVAGSGPSAAFRGRRRGVRAKLVLAARGGD